MIKQALLSTLLLSLGSLSVGFQTVRLEGQSFHGADLDEGDGRGRPSWQRGFDERDDPFHWHRLLGWMARRDGLSEPEHIIGNGAAITY